MSCQRWGSCDWCDGEIDRNLLFGSHFSPVWRFPLEEGWQWRSIRSITSQEEQMQALPWSLPSAAIWRLNLKGTEKEALLGKWNETKLLLNEERLLCRLKSQFPQSWLVHIWKTLQPLIHVVHPDLQTRPSCRPESNKSDGLNQLFYFNRNFSVLWCKQPACNWENKSPASLCAFHESKAAPTPSARHTLRKQHSYDNGNNAAALVNCAQAIAVGTFCWGLPWPCTKELGGIIRTL